MPDDRGIHPARLPAYAPYLNPVEGAWANMKNGRSNLAAADVDQLTAIIKNRLKTIQYRPAPHRRLPHPDRAHPRTRTALVSRRKPRFPVDDAAHRGSSG